MPNKKRKITTIEDVDEEQEQIPILSQEDEQSIEALENFSRSFGPKEIRYRIHRIEMGGKRVFKWSDNFSPEDWEQWIQQTFGGGDYEVGAMAPNQMSRSFRVSVSDLPGTMNQGNPGASGGSFLERELLKKMDELTLRLTQPLAAATPVRDIIDGMKAVQEMGGGGSKLGDAIELAKIILDAGREASGRPNTVMDAVVDIAKDVGKPLVQTLAGMLASRQPLPNNNEVVPVQSQNIDDAMKAGIQWLKKQAMGGVDPTALLHLVEANAQEYEPFIRFAVDREFEAFAALDPEISSPTYIHFFKQLHDGLRSDFGKANPVDEHSSGSGGNVPDINSNGKTGKRRK